MTALGEAIRNRRAELALAQDDLGGASEATVRRIEQGAEGPFLPRTLARLDKSLGWKHGTCASIVAGTAGADPNAWLDSASPPAAEPTSLAVFAALAPTLCPYVAPVLLDQAVRAVAALYATGGRP